MSLNEARIASDPTIDCYDEAVEYIKKDPRFASALRIAGGPEVLVEAALAVRSGQYVPRDSRSAVSADYDGGYAAAYEIVCNSIALVAAVFAIRREFKDDAELRISTQRLLREVARRTGASWRKLGRVLHVPSLVISVAGTLFKLSLSDPPSLAALPATGDSLPAPGAPMSPAKRKLRQLLWALPLQLLSFFGTSFAATWAIAAYVAGHAVLLTQSLISIYVWSAFVFSAARGVVLIVEIRDAHRRIGNGVWKQAGSQASRVDMSEHSLLQGVLDFVARVSPQTRKHIKLIIRTDGGPDRAQAIGTLPTMPDYLLIPAPDEKRLNPGPLYQANQYWVLAHEIGHLIDPVERARKGAVWVAVLTASISAAILAPLAGVSGGAAVLIAIAVALCVLRWIVQVLLREAQADYLAIQVMMSAHQTPPERARAYLDYVRSRFALELHDGSLLHRLKVWARWFLLIPSWTSLIQDEQSPVQRLSQWNNGIFSGCAVLIAAAGGFTLGVPAMFTQYSWKVAIVAVGVAFVGLVALTIVHRKFDQRLATLPRIDDPPQ